MTVYGSKEVVTRQDRRRKARMKETIDVAAKRDKTRLKMVRSHLQEQGIEFTEEMFTRKAFIEALDWKHRKRSPSKADMKLASELQNATQWYIKLSRTVARYISRERNGFIWGDSLEDLYEEIAAAPYILEQEPTVTTEDIRFAVDIAVSKKRLRRQEAVGTDTSTRTCIDTYAA